MSTETRIITIFGAKHEISIQIPGNEEYNAYLDLVGKALEAESGDMLTMARLKYFDLWVTEIKGRKKTDIPDRIKSGLMFQLYEKTGVEEKN